MELRNWTSGILLTVMIASAALSRASPFSNPLPNGDLMDTHISATANQFDVQGRQTVLTETNEVDVDALEHARHHRRHHNRRQHRNQNADANSTQPEENAPVARLQMAENYAQMCEQGRIAHDEAVTWKNDICETCQCEGSSVRCGHETCPDLPCDQPVLVENECCPVCPEGVCEAADGRKFRHGAKWHLDDCTFCECSRGRVLCSVEDCEWKECKSPVKVPGQCCPACPDTSCHEGNGTNHTGGSVWKEDVCTHCYCSNGKEVCAKEKCPHINCSAPYRPPGECCYKCLDAVECVVSTWGSWGECHVQECGGGMRRRYRSVVISPRSGGAFCPHMSEAQLCPRLPCNDVPVCPVTTWGSWSHCTATCGNGRRLRMRKRAKVSMATMLSLIDCSTTHMQESMRCYTGSCHIAPKLLEAISVVRDDSHCSDFTWSAWSDCSKACGVGKSVRHQIINNATLHAASPCPILQETKQCHGHKCDVGVNCKVTAWSPWTPCSATCGHQAAKSKHRSILRHPSVGGRPCPRLIATRSCKLSPCISLRLSVVRKQDDRCVSNDGTRHYGENESWDPEECTTCSCVNGRKSCQQIFCLAEPECSNPITVPGFCCPICS